MTRIHIPLRWIGCAAAVQLFAVAPLGAEAPAFQSGQVWECTVKPEGAPTAELLQFGVIETAISRDISRRDNFQNDAAIISVTLIDRYPETCDRVRLFYHIAFTATGLSRCEPRLLASSPEGDFEKLWRKARIARFKWLVSMEDDRGKIVDLHPSRLLMSLRRMRCPG